MAAQFVTVTWTELDIGGAGLNGSIQLLLSGPVIIGGTIYEPAARSYPVISSAGQSVPVVANDSPGISPTNSYYTVTVQVAGALRRSFVCFINFANGASQTLASLQAQQAQPAASYGAYMPLNGGQFTGPAAPAVLPVTWASSLTIDPTKANEFRTTLAGATTITLGTPLWDGQKAVLVLTQDGTGGRAVTLSGVDYGAAGAPSWSTAPGARDLAGLRWNAQAATWDLLAFVKGY